MTDRVERIPPKHCRLLHAWGPWKVFWRGMGQYYGSDHQIARLERSCARCGDLELKTVVSRCV